MTLKAGIKNLFGDAFSLRSDTASQEEISKVGRITILPTFPMG